MRFKADLRAEAWNVEMQIGYHEQVQANGRRAADALSNRKPLSDEALLLAAFRRLVPHGVQGALETTCGDRVVPSGDYAGIATKLDYPCRVDLPPAEVAAAAHALRSDPAPLSLVLVTTNVAAFAVSSSRILNVAVAGVPSCAPAPGLSRLS